MSHAALQFHLIVEDIASLEPWAGAIALPDSPACLSPDPALPPALLARGAPGLATPPTTAVAPVIGRTPALLVAAADGRRFRVNGQPAPLLAAARVGDVLELPDEPTRHLHVTVRHHPSLAPADADLDGKACAACRIAFTGPEVPAGAATTPVYRCPCGAALHWAPDDDADPDALRCAAMVPECPACGRPVVLADGYAFVPEGCHAL